MNKYKANYLIEQNCPSLNFVRFSKYRFFKLLFFKTHFQHILRFPLSNHANSYTHKIRKCKNHLLACPAENFPTFFHLVASETHLRNLYHCALTVTLEFSLASGWCSVPHIPEESVCTHQDLGEHAFHFSQVSTGFIKGALIFIDENHHEKRPHL